MSKHYRPAWICTLSSSLATGIASRKEKHLALKHKQLDNWQISRISLSKRSYAYPKGMLAYKQITMDSKFLLLDAISPFSALRMWKDISPIFMRVA
jgi:hypothetical protein